MESIPEQEPLILARWTYTKEEWRRFTKWMLLRKSRFHYFIYWLRPLKKRLTPEIAIGSASVWTNQQQEPFAGQDRRFRHVQIHDAGELNIMEISYVNGKTSNQIRIPIPKGKLREAIAVQEKITGQSAVR